jgi:methylamine utilization protein MauE
MVSSQFLAAPFFAAAGLLGWAGVAKLRRPGPASDALASAGLPHGALPVRLLGAGELALAAVCVARPTPIAALAMAGIYAAFAAFLAMAKVGAISVPSCGCAGERVVRPSWLHVLVDLVAAAVAVLEAALPEGPPGLFRLSWSLPMHGVSFLAGTVLLAYLAGLAVANLPELALSYRGRRP